MKCLLLVTLSLSSITFGWDRHQVLTRAALANQSGLDRSLEVEPIEAFLKKNFGSGCTMVKARDAVFDGMGRDFEVFYQSHVPYSFRAEWEKANNILTLHPDAGFFADDPQLIGRRATARDILSTYSDEPDWKLDDDVARLSSSNALAEANSGTATRAMRHFWTPGEEFMGVKLDKGQETDQRMQLYYELAMIAFENGDDYWGYRLLANAVHYVQDMAQPYHVRLIINTDMLDMPVAIHRVICEVDRSIATRFPDAGPARCERNETLSKQIVDSAWYAGVYHGLYEEFALALLETNGFSTREVISHDSTDFTPIVWRNAASVLWLDLRSVTSQTQAQIVTRAEELGKETFATFGKRYVGSRKACEQVLSQMGCGKSLEYQLGSSYYLPDPTVVNDTQFKHRAILLNQTHSLLRAAATWTRQFIHEATAPRSPELNAQIKKLRQKLAAKCSAAH